VVFVFVFPLKVCERDFSEALGANRKVLAVKASEKFFVRDFCEVEFWEVLQMKKVRRF